MSKTIEAKCDVCGSACGDQGAEISLQGSSLWLTRPSLTVDVCSSVCARTLLHSMLEDFESEAQKPKGGATTRGCKDGGLHEWVGSKCTKCDGVFPVNAAAPGSPPATKGPKKAKGKAVPSSAELYAGTASIPPLPDTPDPLAAKAAGINPNDKAAPRSGDQTIHEPPTWCAHCGTPRALTRENGAGSHWECTNGHTGPLLQVRHGVPGENIGELVNGLKAKGLEVNLVDVAAWPVVQRDVARAWLAQGGEIPETLEPLARAALPAKAPQVFEF